MAKINAVIFDWGGVLIEDPAPGLVSYCSKALGVTEDNFANTHKKYLPEFQKGMISETEFFQKVCSDLKIPTPSSNSLWRNAFRNVYSPNEEMFDLVTSLKINGYKTALLSNTEPPVMEFFYKLDYRSFDVLTFSCNEKTRKPEREIYELTLNKLKTKPSEAIIIDDRIEYIEGAQKVGMKTILFEGLSDIVKKLESYSIMIGPKRTKSKNSWT